MSAGREPTDREQPAVEGRLVVDAMNVIGSRPTGWWKHRNRAVRTFADQVGSFADGTGTDVDLVIDGHPLPDLPDGPRGRLRVHYAPRAGRDAADDRIVELLDELDRPVTVVSADRDLRARAVERGADVVGPTQLLGWLDAFGSD